MKKAKRKSAMDSLRKATANSVLEGDCLELMGDMPEGFVDLVITSPPYPGKFKRYYQDGSHERQDWIPWMMLRTIEMCRACRGMVGIVVNNSVKGGLYNPVVETFVARMNATPGIALERPTIWHKNSPPSRKDWFTNDWEYVLWFHTTAKYFRRVWNWEAIATAPKYTCGGHFNQRTTNGKRRRGSAYPANKLARPRDVHRVTVGGGHMGSPLAHDNEAPFPEKLVEPFILALSNPGDLVLDPFCGSGTTLAVAQRTGRLYLGLENRASQVELSKRRLAT